MNDIFYGLQGKKVTIVVDEHSFEGKLDCSFYQLNHFITLSDCIYGADKLGEIRIPSHKIQAVFYRKEEKEK